MKIAKSRSPVNGLVTLLESKAPGRKKKDTLRFVIKKVYKGKRADRIDGGDLSGERLVLSGKKHLVNKILKEKY